MATWWVYGVAFLVAIAVATIVLIVRAVRAERTARSEAGSRAASGSRVVTWAIAVGWVYAVGVGIGSVIASIGIATGEWPVPLDARPYWPQLPPDLQIGGVAEVAGGGFTHAEVVIIDADPGIRAWAIVGTLLIAGAQVIAALVIARLCQGLRRGEGLAGAGRRFALLAATTIVCGFGWQLAFGLAGMAAARAVLPFGLDDAVPGLHWPEPATTLMIDLWPLFPALGLAALAAAFRYAERLQRDTEGLV